MIVEDICVRGDIVAMRSGKEAACFIVGYDAQNSSEGLTKHAWVSQPAFLDC